MYDDDVVVFHSSLSLLSALLCFALLVVATQLPWPILSTRTYTIHIYYILYIDTHTHTCSLYISWPATGAGLAFATSQVLLNFQMLF